MFACAYTCTDECGSDVKVDRIVKLIGRKVWITKSITNSNEMWARSPKLALSRSTFHYPRADLDKNCKDDIMQGWNWSKFGQREHYRGWIWGKIVGYVANWAKLASSKDGIGPNSAKLALSEGESGPKSGKAGTIVHVDTIQGWTWAQSGQSS